MKKKLLAILLSAAMVVCLMPTMAFATDEVASAEAPVAEEVKEEVAPVVEEPAVEKPAVEETAEEVVEAPVEETAEESKATLAEETAELDVKPYELIGSWSGYKYTITVGGQAGEEEKEQIYKNVNVKVNGQEVEDITINNGVLDFTDAVNNIFGKGTDYCRIEVRAVGRLKSIDSAELNAVSGVGSVANFYKFDTAVIVDKSSDKDVTFNYGINTLGTRKKATEEKGTELVVVSMDEAVKDNNSNYEFVKSSITLKAGEKEVRDYLVLRTDANRKLSLDEASFKTYGFVFNELSNNGKYNVDSSRWVAIPESVFKAVAKEDDYTENFKYAKYADQQALEAKIYELNNNAGDEDADLLSIAQDFQYDEMTYTHKAKFSNAKSGKGVQTGDSNELGLWIALGMLASVAAAGYALKRREN